MEVVSNMQPIFTECTGVAVIKDKRILLGLRADGQGWSLAGGKREPNETMEQCALRELEEEFNLRAEALSFLGTVNAEARVKGEVALVQPRIYSCESFDGEVKASEQEFIQYGWFTIEEALKLVPLFPPSEQGLKLLLKKQPNLSIA